MNLESVRRFCLSFPDARENLQWGETLCFKVRGKIFATIGLDAVPQSIVLKCSPERFAELLETDGIVPAPYVGRYQWAMLGRLDVLPSNEVQELIRQSYELVAHKAPRAQADSSRTRPSGRQRSSRKSG
jgi:predicted DNA-binding protein (MmcQ/YjbR family)